MKIRFSASTKLKKRPPALFVIYSAGNEVHRSNRFREDLVEIVDFLEDNEPEIIAVGNPKFE